MARVNIEDSLWSDARFMKLCILMGDEFRAVGTIVVAWRTAQRYWCPEKKPIPHDVFESAGLPHELIKCGLAEKVKDGIRIKGSDEHFAWWFQRREAGKRGGIAKAENQAKLSTAIAPLSETWQNVPSISISSSSSNSPSPSEEAFGVLGELVGVCDDLFQTMPESAQRSWVETFGVRLITQTVPTAWASWLVNKPVTKMGQPIAAIPHIYNWLLNAQKNPKAGRPAKPISELLEERERREAQNE